MMTTGTPPFDGKKEKEILENIRKMKYSLKSKNNLMKTLNASN